VFIAIDVFRTDKEAYVQDSTLSVSKTLAQQSVTELNGILLSARPMIQEFLIQREFKELTQNLFAAESNLQWIIVYRAQAGSFEKLSQAEMLTGSVQNDLKSFGELTPLLQQSLKQSRVIRTPFKDDRILIFERVEGLQEGEEFVFVLFGKTASLANSFRVATGGVEVFLVDDRGLILFGPDKTAGTFLVEKHSVSDFVSQEGGFSRAMAKRSKDSDGKEWIVSVSPVAFGNLAVVSVVSSEVAFQAVRILIVRSILFFVLLISVSVIISLLASKNLTQDLRLLTRATKRVAEGDFDFQLKMSSKDEVGQLAQSFNMMALEISRLLSQTAEKARMENELKTAKTVQDTLFPPASALIGDLEICGFYEPASEIGGDWWHYSQVEDKIFLWIGDATGHGAPAALITSAAKSAATILERLDIDPAQGMRLLNRSIFEVARGKIMMTFCLAIYDIKTHKLYYTNASHEAPFLIPRDADPIKKKHLVPLNEATFPRLGQDPEAQYEVSAIDLNPGDRVFFYTDGLPDIQNPQGEIWGEREFVKTLVQVHQQRKSANETIREMTETFQSYRQKSELKDDVTFFMIRRLE
jgi:sigma-B regulation protein RsbU (phosphoserine phosphatase)